MQDMSKCLPYQLVCHSLLQMGAIKSLFTILYDESILKLLVYQPPSLEKVMQGEVCVCGVMGMPF